DRDWRSTGATNAQRIAATTVTGANQWHYNSASQHKFTAGWQPWHRRYWSDARENNATDYHQQRLPAVGKRFPATGVFQSFDRACLWQYPINCAGQRRAGPHLLRSL